MESVDEKLEGKIKQKYHMETKRSVKKSFILCPIICVSGGGPAGCHGESETGTGGDESQAVVNSTLTGREGRSPHRPAG